MIMFLVTPAFAVDSLPGPVTPVELCNESGSECHAGTPSDPINITGTVTTSVTVSTTPVTQATSPWVVSGSVTASISGTPNINIVNVPHFVLDSGVITSITNPVTVTGTVSATQGTSPWIISGSVTTAGSATVYQGGTWTVSATQGTSPWIIDGLYADNSANVTTKIAAIVARANSLFPGWTEGNMVPLSVDLSGNLRTISIVGLSGTIAAGYNSSIPLNTTSSPLNIQGYGTTLVTMNISGGTITDGVLQFQASDDAGIHWYVIEGARQNTTVAESSVSLAGLTGNTAWQINTSGFTNFRMQLTTAITGSGTLNFRYTAVSAPVEPIVTAGQNDQTQLNATVFQPTGTKLHIVLDSGTVTSITNALPAGSNVIGGVTQSGGWSLSGSGNFTVVQPTGTNLHTVLDSGTLTSITNPVAVTNAGLTNLDVALSTRLKPADTLAGVTTVGAVTSITNALPTGTNTIGNVNINGNGTVVSGQQSVTGSAVALPSNSVKGVCVRSSSASTLKVYIGPSGVSTSTGHELNPGDSVCLPVSNTNLLYVIASTTGGTVTFIGSN
jgi:hypothetical protein